MTRVTKELRADYDRMNKSWPEKVPAASFEELKRAAILLRRKFMPHWREWSREIVQTSGGRWGGMTRRGYAINPSWGWKVFVHILSHHFCAEHSERHLKMEWEMIKYVREIGWLEGTLKPKPKEVPPKKSRAERNEARAKAMLARALRDLESAQRRLKKWKPVVRRYERSRAPLLAA